MSLFRSESTIITLRYSQVATLHIRCKGTRRERKEAVKEDGAKIITAYAYHRLVMIVGYDDVLYIEAIKMNYFILKGSEHINSDSYFGENGSD